MPERTDGPVRRSGDEVQSVWSIGLFPKYRLQLMKRRSGWVDLEGQVPPEWGSTAGSIRDWVNEVEHALPIAKGWLVQEGHSNAKPDGMNRAPEDHIPLIYSELHELQSERRRMVKRMRQVEEALGLQGGKVE